MSTKYEPYDLNGYISNFIRSFDDGNELLVEVKGMMNVWNKEDECEEYINKIITSGWTKKFMIVGGNVGLGEYSKHGGDIDRTWMYPVLELHNINDTWSIISLDGDSDNYDIGLNNGKKLHQSTRHRDNAFIFQEIWTKSKNLTQWNEPIIKTKGLKDTKRKHITQWNKKDTQTINIAENEKIKRIFSRKIVVDSP